ncbi:DUF4340 domain-containing protein [Singulisphaera acidiphila]|uniref:DUF4340 domain-containing protein n=1 Tax=Singulisphaera acidiphila (strain ATCC BAA-1392 / DSM 18658 / VKM B-2454 / MOB10) TaxID=886293 RepID=L0DN13_SINAD|nr:DUF4340 domain-containing protein [Singulisphaera acidiphila]AGA30061.1 hypothetical protein Sinac_5950 [Singulisphaera acidiphila DSM 18658]
MKKHHTTLLLLTLFFTGLFVLWWASYVEVPTSQELAASQHLVLPQLAKTALGEIRRLTIEQAPPGDDPNEQTPVRLVFERQGDAWQMIEPMNVRAETARLEVLAQNLKNLTKSTEAGTIQGPGAKYGLDPAGVSIQAFGKNLETPIASLQIGKTFGDRLYVRPNSTTSGIEVVDSRLIQGLDQPPTAWREKALFNLATFQVGGIRVTGPGRNLSAERLGGRWRLLQPFPTLGDDHKMEEILGELTSLRVANGDAGFVADNVSDLVPYGLDKDHGVLVELYPVLSQLKPQVILIGKPVPDQDGKYYALQGGQDDVVIISGQELSTLGVDPNAIRSAKVADFEPAQASFIRIEALGRTFDMARTDKGWSIVHPIHGPADHELVVSLLSKLDKLETSEFFSPSKVSTPELSPPAISLKLWQLKRGERLPANPEEKPTGDLKVSLNLGRHDVLRKSVYAQVAGDSTILALPDAFLEALPQNDLAFRERSLINLSPGQISRLTVVRDGTTFVLVPAKSGDPNQWRMEKPVAARADTEAITKALVMLTGLRAQRLITDQQVDPRTFGLDAPNMIITWTTPSSEKKDSSDDKVSTQSLTIGGRVPKSESWYARLSGNPLIFTLGDDVILPFRAEFRTRQILSFSPKQVERLTLHWPERTATFEHHPTPRGGVFDWNLASETKSGPFDLSRIHSLANDLAKLNTRMFIQYEGPFPAASGLATPQLTVEYTLKGDDTKYTLRIGNPFEQEEYYATTASKDEGIVFALGGTGWADLIRLAGERKSLELPDDVFAPDAAQESQ